MRSLSLIGRATVRQHLPRWDWFGGGLLLVPSARLRSWIAFAARGVDVDEFRSARFSRYMKLQVPYKEAAAALGMPGFLLAENCPDVHATAQQRLKDAMKTVRKGQAHSNGLTDALLHVQTELRLNEPVNLAAILDEAVDIWAIQLIGVTSASAQGLDVAARRIVERTYYMNEFFHKLQSPNDIENLVKEFKKGLPSEDGCPPNSIGAVTNEDVLGLIGGPRVLTSMAALGILQWSWRLPWRWNRIRRSLPPEYRDNPWLLPCANTIRSSGTNDLSTTVSDTECLSTPKSDTECLSEFRREIDRALRHEPPTYAVIRCRKPRVFRCLKPRHVALRTYRSFGRTEVFGINPHKCLGDQLALDALVAILLPVFRQKRPSLLDHDVQHRLAMKTRGRDTIPRSLWFIFEPRTVNRTRIYFENFVGRKWPKVRNFISGLAQFLGRGASHPVRGPTKEKDQT